MRWARGRFWVRGPFLGLEGLEISGFGSIGDDRQF